MSIDRVYAAVPAHLRAILLVDPDPDTRALHRESLDSLGYAVAEAADGREALIKALVRPPALVLIMSMTLRYVDGYALSQILRRDQLTGTIPIVMVTAAPQPALIARARDAGADVVLIAPVVDEIASELHRLLTDPRPWPVAHSGARRPVATKAFVRCTTTTPPSSPPRLSCPSCGHLLAYDRSHIGGVTARQAEQWDYYRCASCGPFQYRHRTRKLTRMRA